MTMSIRSCCRSPACLLRLNMAVPSMWMITSDVPVSLSPSSDHSVCNSEKENTEENDAEYVVAGDSDITDDESSSSDINEKQRKCCCLQENNNFHFLHLQNTLTGITCLLPLGSIPLNMCSDDMQLTNTF